MAAIPGHKFYDLYNGVEVTPVDGVLSLHIERFGAVLAAAKGPESDPELKAVLAEMAEYAKKPISSFDPTWHYEKGARVPVEHVAASNTEGMAKIPGRKCQADLPSP